MKKDLPKAESQVRGGVWELGQLSFVLELAPPAHTSPLIPWGSSSQSYQGDRRSLW